MSAGDQDVADQVADASRQLIARHPWIETVARLGWYAKGAVYVLMGVAAWFIARAPRHEDDQASPDGVLTTIADLPGGRLLLGLLGGGVVLYSAWRLFSLAIVRGWSAEDVANRIGYLFSAGFYAILGYTALHHAWMDRDPQEKNTVERLSASMMRNALGRVVLIVGGLVVIAVGGFFVVKGVTRKFAEKLDGISRRPSANHGQALAVFVSGVVGWIGRGVVTGLIGVFVALAAWHFDPTQAHGFDGALRSVADDRWGANLVRGCAIGLALYGIHCIISAPRLRLAEGSTG